jgi:hypothetical protein
MIDEPAIPAAPKRKTRKPAKRKPAAAAPAVETDAFPGLTVTDCARACNANGCSISGKPYCAHPRKGGLQGEDMGRPKAIQRLQKAQKQLAVGDATRRFS